MVSFDGDVKLIIHFPFLKNISNGVDDKKKGTKRPLHEERLVLSFFAFSLAISNIFILFSQLTYATSLKLYFTIYQFNFSIDLALVLTYMA